MKIINLVQNTPEWLAWRQGGYGSSDAAAILGRSKFSTAYKVFLQRKGIIKSFDGNAATEAGSNAEDKAKAEYEMFHGDFEFFTPICIEADENQIFKASLDGYHSGLKRFVEIKYPSKDSHEMARAGQIPEHYWIQMQYQYMVCDEAKEAHYWSYREGDGQKVEVAKDDKFINEVLRPAILAFDELVKNNTPPPLTDDDAKYSNESDVRKLILKYNELKKDENISDVFLKKQREILGGQITELVGHHKVLTSLGLVTAVKRNGKHSYYKFTLHNDSVT